MTDQPRLLVGRVVKAHGLRGEVVVDMVTTETEVRVAPGAVLNTAGAALTIESARPHQDRWLVRFDGVLTKEAADALRGTELFADPLDDPDALWLHELIGAAVIERDGTERGNVVAVHPNPASDLLELDGGALVPERFVVGWEGEADDRRLVIDPPAGLFDLGSP